MRDIDLNLISVLAVNVLLVMDTRRTLNQYLSEDIEDVEKALSTLVKVKLNQNQYDSLVSFVFNVGTGAFSSSTLLKKLNNNDFESVPKELRKWIFAGGKACVGLKKRREAEAILFEADCNP